MESTHGAGARDEGSLNRARAHYRRYLELMGQGRVKEAGEELEKLGRELGGQ